MRVPTQLAAAAGLLLAAAATPCLAFTPTQAPLGSDAPASRFSDPDEAVANSAAAVRDSVVENNLRAQGSAAFTGGSARPYGVTSQSYGFGDVTATTQTYSDGFGFSGRPDAYEPPLPPVPDRHR